MTEVKKVGLKDGLIYRCLTRKTVTLSIRDKSFLKNCHLKLEEFVLLVYLWAHRTPNSLSMSMKGQSSKTVVDRFNLFTETCSKYLIQNRQQNRREFCCEAKIQCWSLCSRKMGFWRNRSKFIELLPAMKQKQIFLQCQLENFELNVCSRIQF